MPGLLRPDTDPWGPEYWHIVHHNGYKIIKGCSIAHLIEGGYPEALLVADALSSLPITWEAGTDTISTQAEQIPGQIRRAAEQVCSRIYADADIVLAAAEAELGQDPLGFSLMQRPRLHMAIAT